MLKKQIVSVTVLVLTSNLSYAIGGVVPGATLLGKVAAWLTGLGVLTCTIALMLAGYKFFFQQARLTDVSNIIIGGILIGSAALIAGLIMA